MLKRFAKPSYLIVLLIVLACIIAYLVFWRTGLKQTDTDDRNFAIETTDKLTQIALSDRNGNKIILKKGSDKNWTLNDSLYARTDAIAILLKTLTRLRVKGPVGENARNNIIRKMASQAVKVALFEGEENIKTYYVGGPTPDEFGTYMYMAGSKNPWVVHVQGFDGYLTPRFSTLQDEWLSRTIFDHTKDQIRSISLTYLSDSVGSFSIQREEDRYVVASRGLKDPKEINFGAVSGYFSNFSNITFEGFPPHLQRDQEKEDSIKNSLPWCFLEFEDMEGRRSTLKIWRKEARTDLSLYDNQGNLLAYDPERLYAQVNGRGRLVHIQIYVFQNILVRYADFILKQS